MISNNILLYNHSNGVFVIGIFAVVSLILIAALIMFMSGGTRNKKNNNQNEA